ncbi:hypothetical protein FOL47_008567 [Perkinsus chesapeaki]|uniref:Uncharacterized protein n=1 Tax=Perkinsus chesapeaki TaxID=330153 RepID=A0A7J6LD73_PERCH|nr:hypothetical protein FOL47_008567 [Perkinsus chesapeaki]
MSTYTSAVAGDGVGTMIVRVGSSSALVNGGLLDRYGELSEGMPLTMQCIQGPILIVVADLIAQRLSGAKRIDITRCVRAALCQLFVFGNRGVDQCDRDMVDKFVPSISDPLVASLSYCPTQTVYVNMYYIPKHLRLLVLLLVNIPWTAFLCTMQSRKPEERGKELARLDKQDEEKKHSE